MAEVAAREGRTEDAAELLALVVTHPFTAYAQREHSQHSPETLRERIAPVVFAARAQASEQRDLDATLADPSLLGAAKGGAGEFRG